MILDSTTGDYISVRRWRGVPEGRHNPSKRPSHSIEFAQLHA